MQILPQSETETILDTTKVAKKEYKKPELEHYGNVSTLVKMNGGAGADGGGLPPFTLT